MSGTPHQSNAHHTDFNTEISQIFRFNIFNTTPNMKITQTILTCTEWTDLLYLKKLKQILKQVILHMGRKGIRGHHKRNPAFFKHLIPLKFPSFLENYNWFGFTAYQPL